MNYIDEYSVEYSEDRKTLLKAPKDLRGEYYVESGVTTIAKSAFEGCENLTGIHIPASFKKLEYTAFKGCKSLAFIFYNGDLHDWLLVDWNPGSETGYKLYLNDTLLEDVIIPSTITEIKRNAFYYCRSIKNLILHSGVSSIGEGAFNKSTLIGNINLPEGVKSIGPHAFFNSNICSVSLPHSIEHIGKGAFAACYSLSSFSMPENYKFMVDGERVIIQKANLTEDFKKKSSLQRFLENPDDVEENTLIAFAGANHNEPYVIPQFVSTFAEDSFCFNTLGKAGIWIKHEIPYFPDDAFRDAKGTVYVLPKLKPYCYKDFPKGIILAEKFDPQYAFKSDNQQITAVVENPFRVLGVYANASQKDITANARKIKRYLEVGKDVEFPTDFNGILPPIKRTEDMVDKALADISTVEGKWKNALFWFVKVDDIDDIALGHLQAHNIEKAKTIWDKKYKWNYRLNLSTLYLLSSNVEKSSSAIYLLYSGQDPFEKRFLQSQYNAEINYEDFLRCVLGDYNSGDIYHGELEEAYQDGLLVNVDLVDLRAVYNCNDIRLNIKLQRHYFQQIEDTIQAAKNTNAKDHDASHIAVNNLLRSAYLLDEYKAYFGPEDEKIKLIADNFANQLLQSAINYYNSAEGDYEASGHIIADWAITAAQKALEIATSQIRKDRCQQNLDILRKNSSRIPPREIKEDKDAIEELLAKHSNTEKTIAQAYALLKESVQYICHIKEYIEKCKYSTEKTKPNEILLDLSTNVVAMALNKIINAVNALSGYGDDVRRTITQAWEVTLSMDKFPMQKDFKKNRYDQNRETLHKLFKQVNPLLSDSITSTYKLLDFRTDEEVWKCCITIAHYQFYLENFKHAKHYNEAKARIKELDDELFGKCKALADYKEYLKQVPNGSHKSEAESIIKETEKRHHKELVQRGFLIWINVALLVTILLTIFYAFLPQQTFVGLVTVAILGYIIGLTIYVGIIMQSQES